MKSRTYRLKIGSKGWNFVSSHRKIPYLPYSEEVDFHLSETINKSFIFKNRSFGFKNKTFIFKTKSFIFSL